MFFSKDCRYVFLIFIIFFCVFYPVNHYGSFDLDDDGLISRVNNYKSFAQPQKQFYNNPAGNYYRPLLETITFFESRIWEHQASGYHLTNLVFHLLNSILLYFIALRIYKENLKKELYSLITALIFAIHPLTTESVVWISGRSDIFATFFTLLAYSFYLSLSYVRFFLVPVSILLGLMCKESAFAIFPMILVSEYWTIQEKTAKSLLISLSKWALVLIIPLGLYLILRTGVDHTLYTPSAWPDSSKTINNASRLLTALAAIGFYMKKLFIPWPLNFGIMEINTQLYLLLCVVFMILNVILFLKKQYRLFTTLILIVLSFSPALIISTGKIAWAPFAERYLYLTLCIWSLGFVYFVDLSVIKFKFPLFKTEYFFALIVFIFALSSFARVLTWRDANLIYTGALQHSPLNGKLLYKSGESSSKEEEAIEYYKKAISVSKPHEWLNYSYMALARYELKNENNLKVQEYLEATLKISKTYSHYMDAAEIMLKLKSQNQYDMKKYKNTALYYYQKALLKKRTPFALYRTGKLMMNLEKFPEAISTFNIIIIDFPKSTFKKNAETIIKRLKKKMKVNNFE